MFNKTCPYCGFGLSQIFGDFTCPNNECMASERLRGSEEMWAVLSEIISEFKTKEKQIKECGNVILCLENDMGRLIGLLPADIDFQPSDYQPEVPSDVEY